MPVHQWITTKFTCDSLEKSLMRVKCVTNLKVRLSASCFGAAIIHHLWLFCLLYSYSIPPPPSSSEALDIDKASKIIKLWVVISTIQQLSCVINTFQAIAVFGFKVLKILIIKVYLPQEFFLVCYWRSKQFLKTNRKAFVGTQTIGFPSAVPEQLFSAAVNFQRGKCWWAEAVE